MMKQIVSVDEFQAALLEKTTETRGADEMVGEKQKTASWKTMLLSSLEDPDTLLWTSALAYLDIVAQCLVATSDNPNVLNSLLLFTTCFFVFELGIQALLFRVEFFQHWGYLLDTFIIIVRLGRGYGAIEVDQQHLMLLNFLKVWRLARLLNSYIAVEKENNIAMRQKVKAQVQLTNDWKEKAILSENIANIYSEEIETLKVALRFAADDLAAARLAKANPSISTED